MLVEERKILNEFEILFAKRVKQYNEDGEEIKQFITPFELEARRKLLNEFHSLHHKKMVAKSNMKKRIINRVSTMDKPCFCTFTLNKQTIDLKFMRDKLRKCLKKVGIDNYCLITDYGEKNGREHFHGFIDTKSLKDNEIIKAKSKRYLNGFSIGCISEDIGFNLCVPLMTSDNDLKSVIGYCLKYATKDISNTEDFEHSMFCSRCKNALTPTQKLLLEID